MKEHIERLFRIFGDRVVKYIDKDLKNQT